MAAFPSAEPTSSEAIDRSIAALREHSFVCSEGLFELALLQALHDECLQLHANGALTPAVTGRGESRAPASTLRGDSIRWLDADATAAQCAWLDAMDRLRTQLNRQLLLGLEELEAHFALYPPGAGYARHLDRFRDDDARVVSLVCYLTPDWRDGDGGQLRLHLPDGPLDIAPRQGTSVMFLSADIEHEVQATQRERASIAAWFRRRALPSRP